MEYQHTQRGYVALPTFLLFVVISIPILIADDQAAAEAAPLIVGLMALIVAVVLLFSFLTVTVSGGRVTSAFGFGWPRKTIDLAEVSAVRRVRNSWWYGWGIRKVPNGWMYNVWGYDAVELDLPNGKAFRIGTDEPEKLLGVLSLQVQR